MAPSRNYLRAVSALLAATCASSPLTGGPVAGCLGPAGLGSNYCVAAPNSVGLRAVISAHGSASVAANDLTLEAHDLPPNQFGIFLVSRTRDFAVGTFGVSNGNLCLGGAIGRFRAPGQVLSSGSTGSFSLTIDLTFLPEGNQITTVVPGDTFNFQAWHRDTVGLTNNFTDGLELVFQ